MCYETEVHQFFCTVCGQEGIPIPRKKSKQKEVKHLKKLYCIYCQEATNHCEITASSRYSTEDFFKDFNKGVFKTNSGKVITNEENKSRV